MLKPVRWNTFVRDFIVIQIGFAVFGLSIALMIRSHLGTTPWAVLEVALSQLTGFSIHTPVYRAERSEERFTRRTWTKRIIT